MAQRAIEAPEPGQWLEAALAAARGRWVMVLEEAAAGLLARRHLVEQLLRVSCSARPLAVALADASPARMIAFSPIPAHQPVHHAPGGVAWERRLSEGDDFRADLGATGSPAGDLVLALQAHGAVQWRSIGSSDFRPAEPDPLRAGGPA